MLKYAQIKSCQLFVASLWKKEEQFCSYPVIRSELFAPLPRPALLFCCLSHWDTRRWMPIPLTDSTARKMTFSDLKGHRVVRFLNPHQFNPGWVIWTWEMDWFGGLRFWPKTPVTSIYHPIWRQSSLSWQKTAFFVFSDFWKFQVFLGS